MNELIEKYLGENVKGKYEGEINKGKKIEIEVKGTDYEKGDGSFGKGTYQVVVAKILNSQDKEYKKGSTININYGKFSRNFKRK